jgi:hypothetical protein
MSFEKKESSSGHQFGCSSSAAGVDGGVVEAVDDECRDLHGPEGVGT